MRDLGQADAPFQVRETRQAVMPARRHWPWFCRHLARPGLSKRAFGIIIGTALIYGAVGWLGLQIPFPATYATLIWAPSGIALYAVLRWGWAGALGVICGTGLLNAVVGQGIAFILVTSVGNALPAVIASRFLRGAQLDHLLGDTKRVTRYLAVAVMLSTIASALVGATAVKTIGRPVPGDWLHVFLTWWAGDAMGILTITPALLAVGQ